MDQSEVEQNMNAKVDVLVRKGGFEPPRLTAPPPQDGASASSATSARGKVRIDPSTFYKSGQRLSGSRCLCYFDGAVGVGADGAGVAAFGAAGTGASGIGTGAVCTGSAGTAGLAVFENCCNTELPEAAPVEFWRMVMAIDVNMNMIAHHVVAFERNVAAPRGPNAVWLPAPPNAPARSAASPLCNSTTMISRPQTKTCSVTSTK